MKKIVSVLLSVLLLCSLCLGTLTACGGADDPQGGGQNNGDQNNGGNNGGNGGNGGNNGGDEPVVTQPPKTTPSEGLFFEKSNDGTYYIFNGMGDCTDTDLLIPDTYEGLPVKGIGHDAFSYGAENITRVVMPDSITEISHGIFGSMKALETVVISNGITTLPESLFSGCSGLKYVTLPSSLEVIESQAFHSCESLKKIELPDTLTHIGHSTFANCKSLTEVTLPAGVIVLAASAFDNCTSLTEITIPKGVSINAYLGYGDALFAGCTALAAIHVDAANETLASVDGDLYNKDKTMLIKYAPGKTATSVTVPSHVTEIGAGAFYWNDTITAVTIPGTVKNIGGKAFTNCHNLKTVTIGSGVEIIGSAAFRNTALERITIPASVTKAYGEIFRFCEYLTDIYCEASSQPEEWSQYWSDCNATVHWGSTGA